jgi:hypothetical protein
MTGTPPPEAREALAAIEHERWAHWQRYMHSKCTRMDDGSLLIPAESVTRWERQVATPYAELSEREKESDREQVDRYWPLAVAVIREQVADEIRTRKTSRHGSYAIALERAARIAEGTTHTEEE